MATVKQHESLIMLHQAGDLQGSHRSQIRFRSRSTPEFHCAQGVSTSDKHSKQYLCRSAVTESTVESQAVLSRRGEVAAAVAVFAEMVERL